MSNSSFLHRPRAKNSLSLSFSFPSLSFSLPFSPIYIYIYIKPHDENLTDPRSSIYRCLLVPKSTRVILVGIYLHVKNHTFFNTRVSIDREKNLNRLLHFIRFRSTAHGSSFDESLSTHRSILRRANHPFFLFKFRAVRVSSSTTFTLTYLSYRRDPQLVSRLARCFPPTPNDSFVSSLSLSLSRTRTPSLYFFPFLSCSAPHPLSFTRSPSTHRIGQTGSGHH